jgi:hypothetical protein
MAGGADSAGLGADNGSVKVKDLPPWLVTAL